MHDMKRRGAKGDASLTVDAAVGAVRPPPLLRRAVRLAVVDVEVLRVQALHLFVLVFSIGEQKWVG